VWWVSPRPAPRLAGGGKTAPPLGLRAAGGGAARAEALGAVAGTGGGAAAAMSSSGGSAARLCRLERGPDGYGFHLHGEKGKPGQFIRLVEAGSPAERSGLRAGDRLLEVDGENVERESHQQVVERIRAAAGTVSLLVVDPVADEQLQKRGGEGTEPPGQAAPEPVEPAAREPGGGGQRVSGRGERVGTSRYRPSPSSRASGSSRRLCPGLPRAPGAVFTLDSFFFSLL